MKSVLETSKPRPEILAGTFNPEVFTASLSPVIKHYRHGRGVIDSIYTNAVLFFREATYPTQGLRLALAEVFGRIAGDTTVPAIHRLETAFGGGKTHTLIACAHIAHQGQALQDVVEDFLDPGLLPEPGSVVVVGVAGDEIPVHKPRGEALVPYTLWGEIAYQIGGEELYREVESEAGSQAAPGQTYFEKVLGNRKAVIMLDELAQYAARLEAARPDGAGQLAAFLLGLHGYVRNHPGIAVVLTLASASDAFARQTEQLAKLIAQVRGAEVGEDDALEIGETAVRGVASVVARDAVQVTPVQAAEISSVLAKRLFVSVDREAAEETAEEYMQLYRRNASLLPAEASSENFKDRMIVNYPFHPTLIDFLNKKLADAENFQGTRGVLRVLSLAVRNLWLNRQDNKLIPMIQACHLDLRSERVVNELLGRTGSSDLLFALNADVGGVDTGTLEGGHSNAELADRRNPHPEGHPFYEYTWKTVFLHSLVGREQGLESRIFGLGEPEALFCLSFPGLTPPQVRMALEEINESAFYLRYEQGKYFASNEPTINSVLARIRRTLSSNEVRELLAVAARNIITNGPGRFHIEHDVALPEHLPDGKGRPALGVVSLTAGTIEPEAFVTTKGPNRPREQQNLIFLLVPETVTVGDLSAGQAGLSAQADSSREDGFFQPQNARAQEARQRIEGIARQVKALRLLRQKPQNYGLNPGRLEQDDFRNRYAEREQALQTAVAGVYTGLYYPSTVGHIVRKEIKTAGGEGGRPFIEQIIAALNEDGELLTGDPTQAELLNLNKLFFAQGDTVTLEKLRRNFCCLRTFPVLENLGVLTQIVRAGVREGIWGLAQMDTAADFEGFKPAEFYHRENEIPLGVNLDGEEFCLITLSGAKQRGWTEAETVDPARVPDHLIYVIEQRGAATVQEALEEVVEKHGGIPAREAEDVVATLVKNNRLVAFQGTPDQESKPNLIHGSGAALYTPQPGDVLITPVEAARRNWDTGPKPRLALMGNEGVEKVLPLLRRLGSLYSRGARSVIENLDMVDLELPAGGRLRLQLTGVSPASMKALGEIFEALDGVVRPGDSTEVFLEIIDPDENCPFVKGLRSEERVMSDE